MSNPLLKTVTLTLTYEEGVETEGDLRAILDCTIGNPEEGPLHPNTFAVIREWVTSTLNRNSANEGQPFTFRAES